MEKSSIGTKKNRHVLPNGTIFVVPAQVNLETA